ncbi:MAG: BatD family protein [Candidatus Omnitrophota bacterium]
MKKIFTAVILMCALCAGSAFGRADFQAELEMSRVSIGNPLYLYLTFYGGQSVNRPDVPAVDGLQIKYVGPFPNTAVDSNGITQSITFRYLIIPMKKGEYTLGPFFAEYQGQMYRANPVVLVASDQPSGGAGPSYSSSAAGRPGLFSQGDDLAAPYMKDRLFIVIQVDKPVIYVNEVVPFTIKIYVDGLGLKDIEYPVYPHEGLSTGKFLEPERRHETYRGNSYDVLVFRQDLFGLKEGDHMIGPATLKCKMVIRKEMPRRSSLFGRSVFDDDFMNSRFGYNIYPVELESNEVMVTILPFPEQGRTSDFEGAVGDFKMAVSVDPADVKMGDPVTLKITVSGEGNLDTVTAPRLENEEGFKVYEPQVSKKEEEKIKVYEQVIIPKDPGIKSVPAVVFSFFNPYTRQYVTLKKGPFPINIIEQPEATSPVKFVPALGGEHPVSEEFGKDILHIKEGAGVLRNKGYFLYRDRAFIAAQIFPLLLFIVLYQVYRKKERIVTDRRYARSLKAPRSARGGMKKARICLEKGGNLMHFYDIIFKTLQEYFGNRFDLPKGDLTYPDIAEHIKGAEYDAEVLGTLREIFSICEIARFGASVPEGKGASEILRDVSKIIDYFEKNR